MHKYIADLILRVFRVLMLENVRGRIIILPLHIPLRFFFQFKIGRIQSWRFQLMTILNQMLDLLF